MGNVHIVSTLQNKLKQKKSVFNSSSTVFLGVYNPKKNLDTEVSLLNHFILKRGIEDVVATFELRSLTGEIKKKYEIKMNEKRVYSFRLGDHLNSNFLGSIYLFFKSNENLAIPFCAVMFSIKTLKSVCGLHTYGRRLEQKELGTTIDLSETIETGWTIKDTNSIKSFAVLHGGESELNLNIKIECTNHNGKLIFIKKKIKLQPYGSLILILQELSKDIIRHLEGKRGHAKVFIKGIKGIFPRMLCGNFVEEDNQNLLSTSEIQFTHTNFDFSTITQPDAESSLGYYNQPSLPNGYGIVYPVNTKKIISVNQVKYIPNTYHKINIEPMSQVKIKSKTSNLPSRFVTAAVGNWNDGILESECSTGTFIEDYLKLPCHWHWGMLKPGLEKGFSEISILFNKFDHKLKFNRELNLKIFDEEKLIFEKNIKIDGNKKITSKDILSSNSTSKTLWYVLSGERLEDLNIFSTFYPSGKAGFVEHAF
mgnify:FL=1